MSLFTSTLSVGVRMNLALIIDVSVEAVPLSEAWRQNNYAHIIRLPI